MADSRRTIEGIKKARDAAKKAKTVSGVQTADVIAICCGDLHFSHRPPVARSIEEDWYSVQLRYINQLKALRKKCEGAVPILCAGDITDRWNNPPELANFLLKHLPHMYAVCGQHDLPNHSYDQMHRSTYGTLVEAGKITNLDYEMFESYEEPHIHIYGFHWGEEPTPLRDENPDDLHIAMIHSFIWMKGYGFPGAPQEHRVKKFLPKLRGYDVAIFGDNHKGFARGIEGKKPFIFNCGTFMRRKIDEKGYFPQVGLLLKSGVVIPHQLDVSEDKFIDVSDAERCIESVLDAGDFLLEMSKMGKSFVDFADAVKQFCQKNNIGEHVQAILAELLEK